MSKNISLCLKITKINASTAYADYYNKVVLTNIGQILHNHSTYTWYNDNLRNLLGPIHNKYDKFNISLNSIATGVQVSIAVLNPYERNLQIKLYGLQWLSFYNQATQNNNSNKVIKLIKLSAAANGSDVIDYNEEFYKFLKGFDIVDITINLHNVDYDTNSVPTANRYMVPHIIFNFNVQGVPEVLNYRFKIEQKSITHANNVSSLR